MSTIAKGRLLKFPRCRVRLVTLPERVNDIFRIWDAAGGRRETLNAALDFFKGQKFPIDRAPKDIVSIACKLIKLLRLHQQHRDRDPTTDSEII